MNRLFLSIVLVLALSSNLFGQSDSLDEIHRLYQNKKYKAALHLAKDFQKNNPQEPSSYLLYLQILSELNQYKRAIQIIERSVLKDPISAHYFFDFGKWLYEKKNFFKAKNFLLKYLEKDSLNTTANKYAGNIFYWEGNMQEARKYYERVVEIAPNDLEVMKDLAEIRQITVPYCKIMTHYYDDTQPMSHQGISFEAGKYSSNFIAPKLKFNYCLYDSNRYQAKSFDVELENKFSIPKANIEILAKGGLLQAISSKQIKQIWSVYLKKKLYGNFSLEGSVAKKNYQNTLSNFLYLVQYTQYSWSLNYKKEGACSGSANYINQQFKDLNFIQTYDFWLLSRPLKFAKIELYIGYDFNFANSHINRYTLNKAYDKVISEYDSTGKITAAYVPYFTPQNQIIHSEILSFSYVPSNKLRFTISANYGFWAKAASPYLYFDYNSSKQLVMIRDFYPQKYTPFLLVASFVYSPSKSVTLHAEYRHQQAFFFNSDLFTLSFNYKFFNGK